MGFGFRIQGYRVYRGYRVEGFLLRLQALARVLVLMRNPKVPNPKEALCLFLE